MNKYEGVYGALLCGGHGYFEPDKHRSKLVAKVPINGRMTPIARVPYKIMKRLRIDPIIVVVNGRFSSQIMNIIGEAYYAHQPFRSGAAGALEMSFPLIRQLEGRGQATCNHLLVLYGDMPCWRVSSIKKLIDAHLNSQAVITMFEIKARGNPYGRILKDKNRRVICIKEPEEMSAEELKLAEFSNPSAWVFNYNFIKHNINLLPWHANGDGYGAEIRLPDLVKIAYKNGQQINELFLRQTNQALGVNNYAQLQKARKYLKNVKRE